MPWVIDGDGRSLRQHPQDTILCFVRAVTLVFDSFPQSQTHRHLRSGLMYSTATSLPLRKPLKSLPTIAIHATLVFVNLKDRQTLFARLLALLITEAFARGYEVTLGECWRSPEEARRLAGTGQGIARSLHSDRLAVDLNLFKNGQYLSLSEQYAELGEWWETQNALCRWGGRFSTRPDGNHFSVTYQGRA